MNKYYLRPCTSNCGPQENVSLERTPPLHQLSKLFVIFTFPFMGRINTWWPRLNPLEKGHKFQIHLVALKIATQHIFLLPKDDDYVAKLLCLCVTAKEDDWRQLDNLLLNSEPSRLVAGCCWVTITAHNPVLWLLLWLHGSMELLAKMVIFIFFMCTFCADEAGWTGQPRREIFCSSANSWQTWRHKYWCPAPFGPVFSTKAVQMFLLFYSWNLWRSEGRGWMEIKEFSFYLEHSIF